MRYIRRKKREEMIAVLMATYNGETYLREQLDSILSQTLQDIKIYIHDDGSKDATVDIVKEYMAAFPNRIFLVEGEPTGSGRMNFLYLLGQVEADYYMFSDQDDVWLPEKAEKCMEALSRMEKENGDIPLLTFSDMKVVNEDLSVIDNSFMYYNQLDPYHLTFNRLVVQNTAAGCTMLFNRRLRDEAVRYKKAEHIEHILAHDWWMILTASALGEVRYVDEPLSLYRQHSGNLVGAVKETGIKKKLKLVYWLVTFTHVKLTKERIEHFVLQGQELAVLPLKGEPAKIVKGLRKFYDMNKIERVRFVRRFKLFRNKRNLWQEICL